MPKHWNKKDLRIAQAAVARGTLSPSSSSTALPRELMFQISSLEKTATPEIKKIIQAIKRDQQIAKAFVKIYAQLARQKQSQTAERINQILSYIPLFSCSAIPSTAPQNHEILFAALATLVAQTQKQPVKISILGTELQRDSFGKIKTVLFNFKDLNAPIGSQDRTLAFDLYSTEAIVWPRFYILEPYTNLSAQKSYVILGHLFNKPQNAAAYRINSYPNKISFSEIVQMAEKASTNQPQIKTLITEALTPHTQYNPDQFPASAQPATKYYTGITLRQQGPDLFVDVYYCAPANCATVQSVTRKNVGELRSPAAQEVINAVSANQDFSGLKTKLGL
jgi:hypothetical protein